MNLQHLAEGSSGTQLPCEISAFDLPPFPAQAQRAGLQYRVEHEPNASFRIPLRTFGTGQVLSLATDSYMARHVGAPQPSPGGRTREHFQRQVDEGTYLGRQVAVARVHREHLYCRRLPRHQDGQ